MSPEDRRSRFTALRGSVVAGFVVVFLSVGVGTVVAEPTPEDPTAPAPASTTLPETSTTTAPDGETTTSAAPETSVPPGGFGPPQEDPDAPEEPPMPDPSPEIRVLVSQLRLQTEQDRLDSQLEKLDRVLGAERQVERVVSDFQEALRRAEASVAASENRLRSGALSYYIDPGQTGIEKLISQEPEDERTRTILIGVSIELELETRIEAIELVAKRKRDLATGRADLEAARARTAAHQTTVSSLTEARDHRATELSKARQMSPDWALPISGTSVFTAEELALWFEDQGVPSYAQVPIPELAKSYIDEGRDEHIRGDMAFAQSVLETGSFSNDDTVRLNNFAGIGHCDTCPTGFSFATPQLGVRAQIQLLRDYTQRNPKLAHPLVDSRLKGPSGCCGDWTALTSTWATNTNYGAKILGVYREMLHWLVGHRNPASLADP